MYKGKGFPYPVMGFGGGGGQLEIKGPSVKISEIKAEKFVIEENKDEENKGIPIVVPDSGLAGAARESEFNLRTINISYDLIKSDSKVFASVNIKWSDADSSLVYQVTEPKLNPEERILLSQIKTLLVEKLEVDFTTLRKGEATDYLINKFEEMLTSMSLVIPEDKKKDLLYYIKRDFIGMGKIEPLMMDPNLEDVSCDGVEIPLYVYHRNPLLGSVKTNIYFETAEELDIFVNKLAQKMRQKHFSCIPPHRRNFARRF